MLTCRSSPPPLQGHYNQPDAVLSGPVPMADKLFRINQFWQSVFYFNLCSFSGLLQNSLKKNALETHKPITCIASHLTWCRSANRIRAFQQASRLEPGWMQTQTNNADERH